MKLNQIQDDGKHLRSEFASLDEFADYSGRFRARYAEQAGTESGEWYGGPWDDTYSNARYGWDEHLAKTLALAEETVTTVETTTEVDDWCPVWGVSGAVPDIGAYLAGEPECMIDYPPSKTTKAGRIVTLCASVAYSSRVSPESLVKRGMSVTAFALELGRLGLGVELYADFSVADDATGTGKTATFRTLLKSANDLLDPSRILFAYAHPGMLRVLSLAAMHGMPPDYQAALHVGVSYGKPAPPPEDLPEGTIYLPEVRTSTDIPDADVLLERYLRELELIS